MGQDIETAIITWIGNTHESLVRHQIRHTNILVCSSTLPLKRNYPRDPLNRITKDRKEATNDIDVIVTTEREEKNRRIDSPTTQLFPNRTELEPCESFGENISSLQVGRNLNHFDRMWSVGNKLAAEPMKFDCVVFRARSESSWLQVCQWPCSGVVFMNCSPKRCRMLSIDSDRRWKRNQ